MKPAQYYRENKNWSLWLGKVGTVVASTYIRVSSPEFEPFTPYSFVLVDFGDQKKELMGAGHEQLAVGDKVQCVLRKLATSGQQEIIAYGIKAKGVKN